jgi:hypothetical protein
VSNGAGMPCGGLQYARIDAFNPGALNPPAGGPQPADGLVNELYIPIPAGAQTVTLCWDFYNAEGGPTMNFNDGMAIEIVPAACGPAISTIVYADTFTALGGGIDLSSTGCASLAPEVAPAGPQTAGPIGLITSAAFIRVKVWNGGDNSALSTGLIDEVTFTFAPTCTLTITAPFGPGSISVITSGCAPGDSFALAVTLSPGIFPLGWFFGVDIALGDLMGQVNTGFPFSGVLDGTGGTGFTLGAFVPSGLTVFAVTATFTPGSATTPARRRPSRS